MSLHPSLFFLAALSSAAVAQQAVTTPSEHLGREVGVDFELADWQEVSSYFQKLARESPRVLTNSVGKSTEGRDFLLSVISSESNLTNLDRIRECARLIADPRGTSAEDRERAIADGRPILFVSCAMHATETAAPQFAMDFAHRLATSEEEPWTSAREELVVLLAPSLNPDGLDHVVGWYRETVGTPYEAASLTKLYQYYAGHDNNRDWFMLTQSETRIVTELLYSVWFPQVYWDVHQQGSRRERLFVPPFRDPLNPNLDPMIIAGIGLLGSRALRDLTAEGLSGVSTGVSYDMWWNGGNRNVPVRRNIVGLLTEAASVRIATPTFLPRSELQAPRGLDHYSPSNRFPDPWPGGWWRLRDIIDYELAFGRSLLGSLAREPKLWLHNALAAAEHTIQRGREEAPFAWLLPSDNRDPGAVLRLLEALLLTGVEIHRARADFVADGRSYPAGTLVIRRDQPYGAHVKDLFEVQRYPEGQPPYDVAGWTLPLLLGVRRVEVIEPFGADSGSDSDSGFGADFEAIEDPFAATSSFQGDPRTAGNAGARLSSWDSRSWQRIFELLPAGKRVHFVQAGEQAGTFELDPSEEPEESEQSVAAGNLVLDGMPRVGLYSPWSGSMDEGWMRYVFDSFGTPYVTVRNEMLRAGDLSDLLDVLVLPSLSPGTLDAGRSPGSVPARYAGGLDPEGAVAVEEFVRNGGRLIALGSSSRWVIDLMRLPLVDTTSGEGADEFSCPGSVLRGVPQDHPLTAGLPSSVPLLFSRSSAWRSMQAKERKEQGFADADEDEDEDEDQIDVLLRYAPTRTLMSGWIRSPEVIAGRAAWLRARYGAGDVHLFGFRPQYRGWTQSTFQLVFRAILLEEAR